MAAPHVAGLALYLKSLCTGELGLAAKDPVQLCEYMKETGTAFTWASVFTNPIGTLGLPVPGIQLPTCPFADYVAELPLGEVPFPFNLLPIARGTGKRVFNGGGCQCAGWE